MQLPKIRPVLLSGGFGTRLWPLSHRYRPKQFIPLLNKESMFAMALKRVSDRTVYAPPLIIASIQHVRLVSEILFEQGMADAEIMLEPMARNTAAAAIITSLQEQETEMLHLLMPSDHHITDEAEFHRLVQRAAKAASQGRIVLFGITPHYPATGYGYVMSAKNTDAEGITEISSFIEKPNSINAARLIAEGALWNSGIFLYFPETLLKEARKIAPLHYSQCRQSLKNAKYEDNTILIDPEVYALIPPAALDTLIMEKTMIGSIVPASIGWNDVGSWQSLWEIGEKDSNKNVVKGEVLSREVNHCYIHAEGVKVAAIGMEHCLIVARDDTILVSPLERSQEVRDMACFASTISDRAGHGAGTVRETATPPYTPEPHNPMDYYLPESEKHTKIFYRPWGEYETIAKGKDFLVKHIHVHPAGSTSLQQHYNRSENWTVISGVATVECEGTLYTLSASQSMAIPRYARHRLSNNTTAPLKILEIQMGEYLGEDDITRIEDKYGRV